MAENPCMTQGPDSAHPLRRAATVARVPALVALLLATGCRISVNPRDPFIGEAVHSDSDIAANIQQIRLRMRSLVDPMSGEIETAADRILASTTDPAVRRAAIAWKAEAVPAIRESLFQPDPLTALFDTWVFTNQMAVYFSSGPGAAELGSQSRIAVATSMKLERQVNEVAASFTKSGDVTRARDAARQWATAHPITTGISHRESTLTRATERELGPELTATETLGSMTMTVDDLNRRLEVYADQLLRQVRWEAQIISMDLAEQFELDAAMPLAGRAVDSVGEVAAAVGHVGDSVQVAAGSIETLVPLLERAIVVAEQAPELVTSERAAAIAAVHTELDRTIQFVSKERETALQHITAERLAALQTLHDTIITEREVLTDDVRTISVEAIDHAFWRATQLVAAVLGVLLLAALAGLFLLRRMVAGLLRERQVERTA